MRPILLTFCGINSYESRQTVDFERLTNAGLFGIFGATGSGKSTLIDACTMALYSETPRQNARDCIHSGASEMYVSLEFELNAKRYIVERFYTRDKISVRQKRARLYEKNGDVIKDKPSEIDAAITNLLGLNYKDFSRSVVLPQGKFSEFLMLAERERSDMLERIFGLEEYGDQLIRMLRSNRKDCEAALLTIVNNISFYGDISSEKLASEEAALIEDQDALDKLKETRGQLHTVLERTAKQLALEADYEKLNKRFNTLNELNAEMDKKRAQLKIAGISKIIMPFIKSTEETSARITELETGLAKLHTQCVSAESILEKAQVMAEEAASLKDKALPALMGQEARISRAQEIDNDRQLLNKEREDLLEAYKIMKASKQDFEKKLAAETKQRENIRLELERYAKRKSEIMIPPERRQDIAEAYGLAQEGGKLALRLKTLNDRIAALISEKNKQLTDIELLKTELERLESGRRVITEALDKLNKNRPYIHELRKGLLEGEPCPVCGSRNHSIASDILGSNNNEMTALEWESEKAELERKLAEADDKSVITRTHSAVLQSGHENSIQVQTELTEEYDVCCNELKRLETVVKGICGERTAVELFREMSANDSESAKIQAAEQELRNRDAIISTEIERIVIGIASKDAEISGIQAAGVEKKERIGKMSERIIELIGEKNLGEYILEVRKEIQAINNYTEETKAAYKKAADSAKTLRGEYESGHARQIALHKTLEEGDLKIKELLDTYGMSGRTAVIEGWVYDPEQLEREISDYDNQVRDTNISIARILAEMPDGLVGVDKLTAQVSALEMDHKNVIAEFERKIESLAIGRERISSMRDGLKKLEILNLKKNEANRRLDLLSELDNLFRGNEFVKYISRRYLRQITLEASRRLREMSANRYALELDGTEFVIRDDYNGGSRRSPRTLSGGETFMVSLCLALALSAIIQLKSNASLEFFFLDEGFGTLDSNTLDTVMNCLEKLRSERMSVGIISHVDELKNRVPVKLNIRYDIAKGSIVEHES